MSTEIASACRQGPRPTIEDAVTAFRLVPLGCQSGLTVLLCFDGAGGCACGEVASGLGLARIASFLAGTFAGRPDLLTDPVPDQFLELLCQGLAMANQDVVREAARNPQRRGMASTAVCALATEHTLYLAWVGDSRGYLFSRGSLKRLTRDHSEVQGLIDAGLLDERDAPFHPSAHFINRCLGQPQDFAPDTRMAPLEPDDLVLLSTDGLTDVLSDEEIAGFLNRASRGGGGLDQLSRQLAEAALCAGTTDNVSVLCYRHRQDTAGKLPFSTCTLTGNYRSAVAEALRTPSKELSHD